MLWNIIRDFFVENFFGGYSSTKGYISVLISDGINSDDAIFQVGFVDLDQYISIGDWLSTTFTIITFVLVFILLILFIKWIFKVVSNTLLIR